MFRSFFLVGTFLLILTQLAWSQDDSRIANTDWEAFSKNLLMAVSSDNAGLQQSAMRHMITYKKHLQVKDAAFNLIRIYRYNKDERIRQLAVVTVFCTQNDWARGFLKSNLKFEDNPTIRRQIMDGILQCERAALAKKDSAEAQLIAETK